MGLPTTQMLRNVSFTHFLKRNEKNQQVHLLSIGVTNRATVSCLRLMADVQEERNNSIEEHERHETNAEQKSENPAETLAPMKLGEDAINPNPKELLVPLEPTLRQKIKAQMPSYSEEDEEDEDFEDEEEEDDEIVTNVDNQMKTQHSESQIEEEATVEMTQERVEGKNPKPEEEEEDAEEEEGSKGKRNTPKRKPLCALGANGESTVAKKPKKKSNNVWTKSTRRWCRRNKSNGNQSEETVAIAPVHRFPDDSREMKICLSKVYKAEKVELSEDRLNAGSCKGYRMVRATRGVAEGAWFFEIRVLQLGPTGHARLGWTTEKGDLQAPVGYDGNSYGYRDIDGTKIHKAVRERYGEEGYVEGDVIGCYVNLPEGSLYAPKPPRFVWHKGQKYVCVPEKSEDPPKVIPGSEISFFRNGVCQGVAFTDLYGGRYYPASSMYTLPNQPNCEVRFNFGPDFDCFPRDFEGRPVPLPMIDAPYHGFDAEAVENNEDHPPENENGQSEKKT